MTTQKALPRLGVSHSVKMHNSLIPWIPMDFMHYKQNNRPQIQSLMLKPHITKSRFHYSVSSPRSGIFFFNWRIITLQNFVVFCQTSTWVSHRYTYVSSLLNLPPHLPPHSTPLGWHMEKAMAPHSSTLAWRFPWMEEPGRLQPMESQRVGHNCATSLSLCTFMHWRRKWQPTPVFLPGESQGQGSLVGCRLWGHTESDTTEAS